MSTEDFRSSLDASIRAVGGLSDSIDELRREFVRRVPDEERRQLIDAAVEFLALDSDSEAHRMRMALALAEPSMHRFLEDLRPELVAAELISGTIDLTEWDPGFDSEATVPERPESTGAMYPARRANIIRRWLARALRWYARRLRARNER